MPSDPPGKTGGRIPRAILRGMAKVAMVVGIGIGIFVASAGIYYGISPGDAAAIGLVIAAVASHGMFKLRRWGSA